MQIAKAIDRHLAKGPWGDARRNDLFAVLYLAILALFLIAAIASAFSQASAKIVTLTGRVSCAKCGPWEPLHKGYTKWTWALHSVSEGDDIVFVVGNDNYKLQGDKQQLLKYMEATATVSGDLEGHTLVVQTVSPVSEIKQKQGK